MKSGRVLCLVVGFCSWLSGSEPVSLDLMVRSYAAEGRIQVVGREAEWIPQVSVWSERALERLERTWKTTIPFQKQIPLNLQMEEVKEVRLLQAMQRNQLRQSIIFPLPEDDDIITSLARAYVLAMLNRLTWGAGGSLPENPEALEPNWLAGAASGLVAGRSVALASQALDVYGASSPPFPELVQPEEELDSFLLYRWMEDTLLADRRTARKFWDRFLTKPRFQREDWIALTPQVTTLRELHQAWDVWWQAERRVLISEFALETHAHRWVWEEVHGVPLFYGLDAEEVESHLPATLPEFEPYLDHPRFFAAMTQWIYRLQAVRFRQSREVDQRILAFERALEQAAHAVHSRRGREQRWAEACALWEAALTEF